MSTKTYDLWMTTEDGNSYPILINASAYDVAKKIGDGVTPTFVEYMEERKQPHNTYSQTFGNRKYNVVEHNDFKG